ncbi:hypothetical protein ACFYT5_24295 [Streptomyces anulatus]|uniref:ATP-dependent DNA ligase n=2 Tax=Streptomyces anulatus TaxID=1892 RepID=UPI0036BBB578
MPDPAGRVRVGGVEYPIRPSLARAVPTPPTGPNWHFEVKVDGHRMILRRIEDGVICYSCTGRIVTSHWMDLAVPAMQQLLPGTTCDGEAVTWRGGRIDFGAVQARAASSLDRARALAARPYSTRGHATWPCWLPRSKPCATSNPLPRAFARLAGCGGWMCGDARSDRRRCGGRARPSARRLRPEQSGEPMRSEHQWFSGWCS